MSGSRWSPRSGGGVGPPWRWGSGRLARTQRPRERAQTEPLAALAALFAVGIGLSLFVGAADVVPSATDRSVADPALDRVDDRLLRDGVVDPVALQHPGSIAPDGYEARIAVLVGGRERAVGPEPPVDADRASRPVTVRVAPGDLRPGRLVVEVWPR